MANITFSSLEGDLRLSQMISSEIALLLKDNASLRNSGFIKYAGSINGMGSDTIRVRKIGLMGYDSFTEPTLEDDAVSETSLTDGHADCTVSRFQLSYKMSDLSGITSFGNSPYEVDPFNLAASIAASYDTLFAELTAAAALGSTGSVGTSGGAFSVSTFFAGIYNLEQASNGVISAGAPGPFYACLHPKALSELQASLRSEQGSVIAQMVATEEMIQAKGQGYAGKLFGVDVYRSAHIDTDGTDYNNFMADAGGLMYADGVPSIVGAAETMQMDKVTIEMSRVPERALSVITGHCYLGLAVLDDARLVKMLSVD
jgi:hypothetical protein